MYGIVFYATILLRVYLLLCVSVRMRQRKYKFSKSSSCIFKAPWTATTLLMEERYKQLVQYLRGARLNATVYPPNFSFNQKRGLRQQAACFEEKDEILFNCSKDSKAGIKRLRRVIVTQQE